MIVFVLQNVFISILSLEAYNLPGKEVEYVFIFVAFFSQTHREQGRAGIRSWTLS
jgi:hypothetical protein